MCPFPLINPENLVKHFMLPIIIPSDVTHLLSECKMHNKRITVSSPDLYIFSANIDSFKSKLVKKYSNN